MDNETIFRLVVAGLILLAAVGCLIGVKRAVGGLKRKIPRLNTGRITSGLRLVILIIALILVLNLFNFPLTAIITTLGAICAVVAIGFVATWSVLSNFSCTFFLILFKPFAIGDELSMPDDKIKGRVVDITLMFTVVEDADGFLVNIPNNQMFQKHFRRKPGNNSIKLSEQIRKSGPAQLAESTMVKTDPPAAPVAPNPVTSSTKEFKIT
jgi:small-conductance mechanosensitive channel